MITISVRSNVARDERSEGSSWVDEADIRVIAPQFQPTPVTGRRRPLLRCREKPQVFEVRSTVRMDERTERASRHKCIDHRSAVGYETPR
jgi:hypothetical protein